jgi:serine-type D-Ala-D-Ala carboxypeptidase/endopeptidase (penicillin-binding protein 4)
MQPGGHRSFNAARGLRLALTATAMAMTIVVATSSLPVTAAQHKHKTHHGAIRGGQPPAWVKQLNVIVNGKPVSVSLGYQGNWLYRSQGSKARIPASNEKLLLSMALLDRLDPNTRLPTIAEAKSLPRKGVIRGNLWVVGSGDPEVGYHRIVLLAHQLVDAGVKRIVGSVIGDEGPFARDDFAKGWLGYFPDTVIPLATALTYHGNVDIHGRIVRDPERRAAHALTKALKRLGVRVGGPPAMGHHRAKLVPVAQVDSARLVTILTRMDQYSINFYAEELGKYLGLLAHGPPARIASGAAAIMHFASAQGDPVISYDGSGLSYANRVSSDRIVRLLWFADRQPWAGSLMSALATGGVGTLVDRLHNVRIHAKTGTLDYVSALSGWVWLKQSQTWAEFSILSRGMPEYEAKGLEDAIVRTISNCASAPSPFRPSRVAVRPAML